MDASASRIGDAEKNNLFGVYLEIENLSYPIHRNQNKSVIKYTRIPDFDVNTRVSWPQKSYTLEPRLRRIIMVEEPRVETRRSLKSDIAIPSSMMSSDVCKRKVVTIEEDDYSFQPKFSQNVKKTHSNMVNRAIETDVNEQKPSLQRKVSRLSNLSKSPKDVKPSTKKFLTNNGAEIVTAELGSGYTNYTKVNNEVKDYSKNKWFNESTRSNKSSLSSTKFSLNKKISASRETEKDFVPKNKNVDKVSKSKEREHPPKRQVSEKTKTSSTNFSFLKGMKSTKRPASVILVPLESNIGKQDAATEMCPKLQSFIESRVTQTLKSTADSSVQVIDKTNYKNIDATDLLPNAKDQATEIGEDILKSNCTDEIINENFDSLDIPNVSLMNNRSDITENIPKAKIVKIIKSDDSFVSPCPSKSSENKIIESHFHKSTSYIISRATLTCTTSQKIDFHVVGNDDVIKSHLSLNPHSYPVNVVSVFKQEMKNPCDKKDDKIPTELASMHSKDFSSYSLQKKKLVKPSDIISTIQINKSLINHDYICDQFQQELNFIDSFFESLQYLENCSLHEKGITEKKVEHFMNNSRKELNNIEFSSFLSKFEDDVNIDDTSTMASKSLCLLNLLIRDEQRRAKNLLFVLKMREDALKDFTKSQILWLENKKKQDNIDISTLKKKQRGALLKLQHECGEMQRMRKALLTLSEKRKLAFMKTKKNIELKLKNSLDVEQIIFGKKKLRRNISVDHNIAPLKCFELSSSGCDESTTTTTLPKSTPILIPNLSSNIQSAEKCVQTNDSLCTTSQTDQSTKTADENFVVVDGGYLNILFHNVSLPQIFSGEKQYEVNQEALKNIVQTSNIHQLDINNDTIIEGLMDQIEDLDRSSTPSTARSLLDEFDKIYKGLAEEEKIKTNDVNIHSKVTIEEISLLQEESEKIKNCDENLEVAYYGSSDVPKTDESCSCEPSMLSVGKEVASISVSGPLPVPAGAAAVKDDSTDVPTLLNYDSTPAQNCVSTISTNSNQALCSSISSSTSPVQSEAEELRRQQLAIEREIKALEQQQCQLLAVREIPDKPPPPYTPPSESKAPKKARNFQVDEIAQQKIHLLISDPNIKLLETDPFDIFVEDYCRDAMEKQKLEKNEKYWDTCNFSPPKTTLDTEKFVNKTVSDLNEVLTSVPATVVSGVGARRSDHIDDILFAEWRRCEPEWTSLHADDVIVKNQVFESIFQKILTETIDEYKKSVITPENSNK